MSDIIVLTTKTELQADLISSAQRRSIDQKFMYLGAGAHEYYQRSGDDESYHCNGKYAYFRFVEPQLQPKAKIAIINLGCGNAAQEKHLLVCAQQAGYDISYIGVDISPEMLHLADKQLADLKKNIPIQLIQADFTDPAFGTAIRQQLHGYDQVFRCFLGRTLVNLDQMQAISSIYNMMQPGEYRWFDVVQRMDDKPSTKQTILERYQQYADQGLAQTTLHALGIDTNAGQMQVSATSEPLLGAWTYVFHFVLNQRTSVNCQGQDLVFLPSEQIELLTIRNYQPGLLAQHIQDYGFNMTDQLLREYVPFFDEIQFLFQKR